MSLFDQLSNDLNPSYQPKHTRTAWVTITDCSGDAHRVKVLYQITKADGGGIIKICRIETKEGFDITNHRIVFEQEPFIATACYVAYQAGELETKNMLYEAENN